MPSTSKAQQRLMGMAYAYKKGELDSDEVSDEVKDIADGMTLKKLKDFASTKHKGLPDKVKEETMNEKKGNAVLNSKKVYDDVRDMLKKMAERIAKDFNVDIESAYRGIKRAADYASVHESANESEDHEVGMAMGQLEAMFTAIQELEDKIAKDGYEERDLPGWIQSHITSAYEYIKQANDNFHELEENITPSSIGGMGKISLPSNGNDGSGDVPAGTGDAEEEYKKKKKKMRTKTFEEFVNENLNESADVPESITSFAREENAQTYLANFDGTRVEAQYTTKTWDDGVPVTKYFSRNGYKTIKPKGEIWIIEADSWWYFKNKGNWYAVSRKEYDRPPFEY